MSLVGEKGWDGKKNNSSQLSVRDVGEHPVVSEVSVQLGQGCDRGMIAGERDHEQTHIHGYTHIHRRIYKGLI